MSKYGANDDTPIHAMDVAEPIHEWFELTYSNYLVVPRSMLQSMPVHWQEQFVRMLEQVKEVLDVDDAPSSYTVKAREGGKFIKDPYADYQKGGRRIPRRLGRLNRE